MTANPSLTESDILARVGETSFERGQRYFLQGAVHTARRQGDTLKAYCEGSQPQPYRVEATLAPAGLLSASCSCPVGAGGYCKHVAALLLTWLHDLEEFVLVDPLEATLEAFGKDELIQLVCEFLRREPALEATLERFALRHHKTAHAVDLDAIRRQVQWAYADIDYDDWRASSHIASSLRDIAALGNAFLERGEPANASAVYRLIIDEVLAHYLNIHDEDGEVAYFVVDCVEKLGRCLEALDPRDEEGRAQRAMIVRALFDTFHWDATQGGYGIRDEILPILADRTTDEERQQAAEWARQSLPAGESDISRYAREAFGGLLLLLQGNCLSDEEYLRICRETGRQHDLIDRLLHLHRIDEVMAEVAQHNDRGLFRLADIFEAQGQLDLFEGVLRQRLPTTVDSRLIDWLKQRALARQDLPEALALQERLFWHRPSLDNYRELKSLAQALCRWEEVEASLLNRLLQEKGYDMLVEIDLEENDVDQALETLELSEQQRRSRGFSGQHPLCVRVAQAAEERRPRDAIRLYLTEAERLIRMLGRGNYVVAAGYLTRVRDLYARLNEPEVWQACIASLRDNHRRQRALKEELNKAGL